MQDKEKTFLLIDEEKFEDELVCISFYLQNDYFCE
jgi:hypothetical protein